MFISNFNKSNGILMVFGAKNRHLFDLLLLTLCYTVSQKMGHAYYASLLSHTWTNFNNFFTIVFVDELQNKLVLDLPPHLKCVAALPREN